MIENTKLYILILVWMTLIFIQGHSCMRNQKLQFTVDVDEIQYVAITCWVVEADANNLLFCASAIQGRELCWCDFMKYMFYIILCHDT